MGDTVKKSRYKLTHRLFSQPDYEALLCVDVESRDKRECLINVYSGALAAKYVGCFDALRHCAAFEGMFIEAQTLNTVFRVCDGKPIDEMFFRGANLEWKTRLVFADSLFQKGLEISDYPPEIACAALLSENVRVFAEEERLDINYAVRPLECANMREAAFLLSDQSKKILLRRYSSPKAEIEFLDGLDEGVFANPVALYSYYQSRRDALYEDYEALYAKPALGRVLYLFFQNLLRFAKRMLKVKKR